MQADMDFGNAAGIGGGFCLGIERCQFFIGGEHGFDQAFGAVGGFLAGDADPPARRHGDSAGIWLYHPGHHAKQRRLAGAVAADEADPVARIDGDAGAVEQRARADAIGDLIKTKHGTAPEAMKVITERVSQRLGTHIGDVVTEV